MPWPDARHREAELRLDQREAAIEKRAIVPGKPGESSLVERITSTDADTIMPPPASHKKLTAAQRQLLERLDCGRMQSIKSTGRTSCR